MFKNKNMGSIDRTIRMLVAFTLLVISLLNPHISGLIFILLIITSGLLITSSITASCPIYQSFGIHTFKIENE